MEDEQQSTLKKKIQILFQLGKWPDVIKLCNSYREKYGADEEIDTIRYKSERHLGVPAASPAGQDSGPNAAPGQGPVAGPPDRGSARFDPTVPLVPPARISETFEEAGEEDPVMTPSGRGAEHDAESPFSDDDLVITDPFAEDGPGLDLAPEPPPVMIAADAVAAAQDAREVPVLEMEEPGGPPPATQDEEEENDLSAMEGLTLDAEPELLSSPLPDEPPPEPEPAPQAWSPPPPEPPAKSADAGAGEIGAPDLPQEREAFGDDSSRSSFGRVDFVEQGEEAGPLPGGAVDREERPRRPYTPDAEAVGRKAPKRGIALTPKRVLLVLLPLLVAAGAWLVLSGKIDLSRSPEPAAAPQPPERPVPVRRRPAAKPVPAAPQVDEKAFSEKFRQAEELSAKGELSQAMAILQEAKKIKQTKPLLLLEAELTRKMNAAALVRPEPPVVVDRRQMESDAFSRAEASGTLAAWKDFADKYPEGELAQRARQQIVRLEKKAREEADQQLMLRIRQAQKVRLRATAMNLSQAEIAAMVRQGGKPPAEFQVHEHGGSRVMLDLSSGLMWNLWRKPMAYDKARWWANRITAGYGGWRLPTAEETLSLLQMDRAQYAGLPEFVVWTGDAVSEQPRTAWALRLPAGQFVAAPHNLLYYVWAVRKAGR